MNTPRWYAWKGRMLLSSSSRSSRCSRTSRPAPRGRPRLARLGSLATAAARTPAGRTSSIPMYWESPGWEAFLAVAFQEAAAFPVVADFRAAVDSAAGGADLADKEVVGEVEASAAKAAALAGKVAVAVGEETLAA